MSNIKISQLPVLSAVGSTSDVLPIVESGTTYQVAISALLSTTGNITGGYIIGNGGNNINGGGDAEDDDNKRDLTRRKFPRSLP